MKVKKIFAYSLSTLVLLFSVVAILGIWNLVDIEFLIVTIVQIPDGHPGCSCSGGADFFNPGPSGKDQP